jgi:hypothetical protein
VTARAGRPSTAIEAGQGEKRGRLP